MQTQKPLTQTHEAFYVQNVILKIASNLKEPLSTFSLAIKLFI